MITVTHLTKRYGRFAALDDVSFDVPAGKVVGFLGPNGAGKSTAMRCMTGLAVPTAGSTQILGARYTDLPNPARRVGVLLDASAQHPGRTGREVLALGARVIGMPQHRVDEMLALVGLNDEEAGRKVRQYSLGMRQRLGIAHALLGDPEVLILDEPANGLDPQGIHWMRQLLRGFADQGGTVLLSSHLLSEVQQVADDLIIIGRGQIMASGQLCDLVGGRGTYVQSTDSAALAAALAQGGHDAHPDGEGLRTNATTEQVGRCALEHRIVLTTLRGADGGDLENLFLELTAGADRAA